MLKEIKETEQITPFSNGTESMMWYSENCERCTKAYFPKEAGEYPKDSTMRQYVSCGKECKAKYFIDWGFVTSTIPLSVAEMIGYTKEKGFPWNCILFSDNDDDRWQAPKRPKPDDTPPNQLVMPFYLQELGIQEIKKEEVFHS